MAVAGSLVEFLFENILKSLKARVWNRSRIQCGISLKKKINKKNITTKLSKKRKKYHQFDSLIDDNIR